jgi:uncharacterized protein YndB with AHSA1/START domain
MTQTERLIRATPERVFEVLSDPDSYGHWVVGSKYIRDADASWPAVGTRFHHTVGIGPIEIKDNTEVEAVEPGRYLQLKARARPAGRARVKLTLREHPEGTMVEMDEGPADARTAVFFNPLGKFLTKRRNDESLARLAELAEAP